MEKSNHKPIYESKEDQEVMFMFAKKFGFYDEYVKGMMLDVVDGEISKLKMTLFGLMMQQVN